MQFMWIKNSGIAVNNFILFKNIDPPQAGGIG